MNHGDYLTSDDMRFCILFVKVTDRPRKGSGLLRGVIVTLDWNR